MSLELYPRDRSTRYEISHAESVGMSRYYNAVGKLNLTVCISDYNIRAIQEDGILYDTASKTAYIIKNVVTDTTKNTITANGYTTNWLLNRRILPKSTSLSNVERDVYSLVNDNLRGLTDVRTAPLKGLPETTESTAEPGEILEQLLPILEKAGLGNRMVWDPATMSHVFEVYKGRDLTEGIHAAVFSDEQGTLKNLVIDGDGSTFKNVAYVHASFEDQEVTVVVGDARGADRYEQWFDISLSKEEGETLEQFEARMKNHGAMELGKLIRRQSFRGDIDPGELGKKYDVGDLVPCVSRRFGIRFHARITGVKYTRDKHSEVTKLILGEPKLTEVRRYG